MAGVTSSFKIKTINTLLKSLTAQEIRPRESEGGLAFFAIYQGLAWLEGDYHLGSTCEGHVG
jgi:hypothetical protein